MMHLSAGELRDLLNRIPEDTPIYIERVEDFYFEKHGWSTSEYQFPGMSEPQHFFRAWTVTMTDGKVLIHAHY